MSATLGSTTSKPSAPPVARILDPAVIFAALATIPLAVLQEMSNTSPLYTAADWLVWSIFLLDYVIMFALAGDKWAYVRRAWLNALIVVLSFPALPVLLQLVRLARLTRLLRILRLVVVTPRGLYALASVLGRRSLITVAAATGFLIVLGGSLLTIVEPQSVEGGVWDGIWWGIVTATTVGYGDIAPQTGWGRAVATVIMIGGIALFSTLSASIAAYFVGQSEGVDLKSLAARLDRQAEEMATLAARLDRIETLLQALAPTAKPAEASPGARDADTQTAP